MDVVRGESRSYCAHKLAEIVRLGVYASTAERSPCPPLKQITGFVKDEAMVCQQIQT